MRHFEREDPIFNPHLKKPDDYHPNHHPNFNAHNNPDNGRYIANRLAVHLSVGGRCLPSSEPPPGSNAAAAALACLACLLVS